MTVPKKVTGFLELSEMLPEDTIQSHYKTKIQNKCVWLTVKFVSTCITNILNTVFPLNFL